MPPYAPWRWEAYHEAGYTPLSQLMFIRSQLLDEYNEGINHSTYAQLSRLWQWIAAISHIIRKGRGFFHVILVPDFAYEN